MNRIDIAPEKNTIIIEYVWNRFHTWEHFVCKTRSIISIVLVKLNEKCIKYEDCVLVTFQINSF